MTERVISECVHKMVGKNCRKCGVYDHSSNPALKTTQYNSYFNCSAEKYLRHLRGRQCERIEAGELSEAASELLQSICEKFEYSLETLALGVYILGKACPYNPKEEKFWAAVALMVASKAIELDKRVPYLDRYQRYADKTFTQEDYQTAERTVLEGMDFDLQHSTFVSFLHFYLTAGFIFKSDSFHPSTLKYAEDDVVTRARDFLKTGEFLKHQP
jgi:hypothetical protein